MRYKKWLKLNTASLSGKLVAITGSTGGIGFWLCRYLAELKANLVLLDRNYERSNKFAVSLMKEYDINVKCITVDLEDFNSVEKATELLLKEKPDVFIHNAGAYSIPRKNCDTGFDNVFQINFVSPYYIIRKLLNHLETVNGRVVVVSSIAHNYSKIDINDIDFKTRKKASLVYGNAKRYLTYSLHKLFMNNNKVSLSVTHPGITFTNITAHYPKWIFAIIKHPMKVIFHSPEKAALSILKGVFNNTKYGYWLGPKIFNVWGLPKLKKINTAKTEEIEMIYIIAESIYKKLEEKIWNS